MPASESVNETLILERVQSRILSIRGQKVILDADLAALYGVPTLRLNEQVKRNANRFPEDFAFRLTPEEKVEVIANCDHLAKLRFSPHLPLVFTEHGVIAAAFILNAPRAVEVSTFVVRAFIQLRRMSSEVASLAQRLETFEQETARRFHDHEAEAGAEAHRRATRDDPKGEAQDGPSDGHLRAVFKALKELLGQTQDPSVPAPSPKRSIGFRSQRK